jgi:pyruvate dehydrogenase E1 component
VEHLSDDDISQLRRGGHDYRKLYAAYKGATGPPRARRPSSSPRPSRDGPSASEVAGRNATHQIKKMNAAQLLASCATACNSGLIPDEALDGHEPPFVRYRRRDAGHDYDGATARSWADRSRSAHHAPCAERCDLPDPAVFADLRTGLGHAAGVDDHGVHACCAGPHPRQAEFGKRIVPIIPDEARTFGMDSLFPEIGIYTSHGQKYEPVDHDLLLPTRSRPTERSWRRASPRPARWPRSPPRRRATPPAACR